MDKINLLLVLWKFEARAIKLSKKASRRARDSKTFWVFLMVVPYGTSGGEMAQHGQGCPDPDVIEETTTTAPGKRFSVPTAMGNR